MITDLKKGMAERGISARSVTAFLVFGAIALVFVFFGLPNKLGGGAGSVATVNGAVISVAEFQKEEQRITEYMSSMFGGNMDMGPQRDMLRKQAIESLVQAEVIHQVTSKEGILAPDAEIRDVIVKDISAFQKDGQFERDYYRRYLEMTRSTEADFELKIRKELKANRLRNLFETALRPSALEDGKLSELKSNQLNVQFARVNEEELLKNAKINEKEVTEALGQSEMVKKAENFFNTHLKDFSSEAEVRAQHILIMAKQGDEAATKKAFEKAESIFKRAQKEDFAKLAKKESEDPGSKEKGGDLGFFGRGRMVKEFEDTAFAAPVGKVNAPIKTSYGFHIIKVLDRKPERKANFSLQKAEAMKLYLAQERIEKTVSEIDKAIGAKEFTKVDGLLKALGVSWEETGFFEFGSDTVPKISSQTVSQSVFEMTMANPWLDRVIREANDKYILKLKDIKRADDAAKNAIAAKFKREQQMVQKRRGDSAFENWLKLQKGNSKVSVNPMVFQNN